MLSETETEILRSLREEFEHKHFNDVQQISIERKEIDRLLNEFYSTEGTFQTRNDKLISFIRMGFGQRFERHQNLLSS